MGMGTGFIPTCGVDRCVPLQLVAEHESVAAVSALVPAERIRDVDCGGVKLVINYCDQVSVFIPIDYGNIDQDTD